MKPAKRSAGPQFLPMYSYNAFGFGNLAFFENLEAKRKGSNF